MDGVTKSGQSRDTVTIGYARQRKKKQRTNRNTEKTDGVTKNGQSRDTGTIGYARQRTRTEKTNNTTQRKPMG